MHSGVGTKSALRGKVSSNPEGLSLGRVLVEGIAVNPYPPASSLMSTVSFPVMSGAKPQPPRFFGAF